MPQSLAACNLAYSSQTLLYPPCEVSAQTSITASVVFDAVRMASGEDSVILNFAKKDPVDVALYLKSEGVSEDICSEFEGVVLLFVCNNTENRLHT